MNPSSLIPSKPMFPVVAVGHTRAKLRRLLRLLNRAGLPASVVVWNGHGKFGCAVESQNDAWDTGMYLEGARRLAAAGVPWALFINDDCVRIGPDFRKEAEDAMSRGGTFLNTTYVKTLPHLRTHAFVASVPWALRYMEQSCARRAGRKCGSRFEQGCKQVRGQAHLSDTAAIIDSNAIDREGSWFKGNPERLGYLDKLSESFIDAGRSGEAVVVVGCNARQVHRLGPWWDAYSASGSKLPVLFVDYGDWDAGTVEWARGRGEYSRLEHEGYEDKPWAGWTRKPEAVLRAGGRTAVWMDLDCYVRKPVEGLVEAFWEHGGQVAAVVNDARMDERLAAQDGRFNSGCVVLDSGGPVARGWAEGCATGAHANDEMFLSPVVSSWMPLNTVWCADPFVDGPGFASLDATVVHYHACYRDFGKSALPADAGSVVLQAPLEPYCGEAVDAVFMLGDGSRHDDLELRIALRSLEANVPWVRNVFIVGRKPSWARNVCHIVATDPYTHCKDANLVHKLLRACKRRDVSDVFLACSDDQAVLLPTSGLEDFAPRFVRRWDPDDSQYYDGTPWLRSLRDTLRLFGPGAYYFEPHIWTPVDKDKFIDMAEKRNWRESNACTLFTLYGNHAKVEPAKHGGHAMAAGASIPRGIVHLAYNDTSFKLPEFREALSRMFPKPSRYEANG